MALNSIRVDGLPEDVELYAVGDGSRMCTPGLALLAATGVTPRKSGPEAICAEGRSWREALDSKFRSCGFRVTLKEGVFPPLYAFRF